MENSTALLFPGTTESEKEAAGKAADMARELDFPEARCAEIGTAVAEAFRNAIDHGCMDDARIRVVYTAHQGALTVRIDDRGPGIPDLDSVRRDDTLKKRREEGRNRPGSRGWGLLFLKNFSDRCMSETTADGHRLTLYFTAAGRHGKGDRHGQ